jgi:hypothetical protein
MDYPPWNSRQEFLRSQDGFKRKLRALLMTTFAEQTRVIVRRLENALPLMLKEVKNPFARRHVREMFYLVAQQQNGVYALIDYVNFKGEGTSKKERYDGYGWGLLQVLENMNGNKKNVMAEFVRAADMVLTRRVANAPREESQWLPGWRKRLQTYN